VIGLAPKQPNQTSSTPSELSTFAFSWNLLFVRFLAGPKVVSMQFLPLVTFREDQLIAGLAICARILLGRWRGWGY
jgi:hypothetical protein